MLGAELIAAVPPPPMRQRRARSNASEGDDDALERAVLWSASYHRLFGARYGRELLPGDVRPMSCGEASRALEQLIRRPRYLPTARRCLAQMLASGYVPDEHNAAQFRALARRVSRGGSRRSADEAIAELLDFGRREYATPSEETPKLEPKTPRKTISFPTEITFNGDVFTVKKRFLVPFPFEIVRPIVQPRNWHKLGSFWRKPPKETVRESRIGLREGRVREEFVVDWNTIQVQRFDVLLQFTQRERPGVLHTDYSLMYEKNGQLLVDEGFGEARSYGKRGGWTLYTGEKTLKFASAFLNLLSPGVMAMFLESQAASFERMFRHGQRQR